MTTQHSWSKRLNGGDYLLIEVKSRKRNTGGNVAQGIEDERALGNERVS